MRPPRLPAPGWLPGGHAQTLWPRLFARRHHGPAPAALWRERLDTPDGDFVDCDWLVQPAVGAPPADAAPPLLVLFHGLEGSSGSHYSQAFASEAQRLGWMFAIPHFRGCSGELNRAPRAYHSGDHEEVGWMLAQLHARQPESPLIAIGISLGGNALLRWAQEAGYLARQRVRALAAVSAPLDLAAAGVAIHQGLNRQIYTRYFLRTMLPKALRKLEQFPGLVERERLLRASSLVAFDDCFTAPLHGFANAKDYYARASAGGRLHKLRVPSLVLNARNDPFVPAASLPMPFQIGTAPVTLWQPRQGGHAGFPTGGWPASNLGLPAAVCAWLAQHL
jgi:predicted alpha/beta-fold hydrolase